MANYKDIIENCKSTKGGIIETFHALQKEFNYMSEAQAYGVATFYSYLSVEQRGKYIIRMCESAPCHVAGADEVIKAMEDYLGIKVGESTADGKFTLELCECIGQCQATPVISVNSKPIFNVTAQQIPEILGQYK